MKPTEIVHELPRAELERLVLLAVRELDNACVTGSFARRWTALVAAYTRRLGP